MHFTNIIQYYRKIQFVSLANSTYCIPNIDNHQIRSKRLDKLAFGAVRVQAAVTAVAVIVATVTLFFVIMSVLEDNDVCYDCYDTVIVFNNRVCVSG